MLAFVLRDEGGGMGDEGAKLRQKEKGKREKGKGPETR